jgi:hypothetical protein
LSDVIVGLRVVTRSLEFLEFVESACEGAGERGEVAVEFGEEVAFAGLEQGDAGAGFVVAGVVVEFGFGKVCASESPGKVGELVEEEEFGGVGGLVFVVEGAVECEVVEFAFGGEDGELGGEAVFEAVERGDGFAEFGAGAGAFGGVGAVGEEATAAGEGCEAMVAGVEEVFGVGVECAVG